MKQRNSHTPQVENDIGADRPLILVVDDDTDTCDMMCAFLSQDYECEAAYDGQQALAKLSARPYSVVISDLMMPGVDGYAVIRCAAALAPTTPVIVVSGLAEAQNAITAMRTGAFDYLIKPVEVEQVEICLKRAYSHHLMAQAAQAYEQQLAAYAADLERVNEGLSKAIAELDTTYHATISALTTAFEERDVETQGHSSRVATYSLRLGRELGLSADELRALELGALFHDLGKIGIRDAILFKPSRLTRDEWQEMRKHPEKGAKIIEGIPGLRMALPVVLQHHERWDGKGYPAGLAGEQIDLKARIFAVADAVDAITSDRPYDKARSFEEAGRELQRTSGKQFDPRVVEVFCSITAQEFHASVKPHSV